MDDSESSESCEYIIYNLARSRLASRLRSDIFTRIFRVVEIHGILGIVDSESPGVNARSVIVYLVKIIISIQILPKGNV